MFRSWCCLTPTASIWTTRVSTWLLKLTVTFSRTSANVYHSTMRLVSQYVFVTNATFVLMIVCFGTQCEQRKSSSSKQQHIFCCWHAQGPLWCLGKNWILSRNTVYVSVHKIDYVPGKKSLLICALVLYLNRVKHTWQLQMHAPWRIFHWHFSSFCSSASIIHTVHCHFVLFLFATTTYHEDIKHRERQSCWRID